MDPLLPYLTQRSEAGALLSSADLQRSLDDLFGELLPSLPRPYKIFFVDENLPPFLGFPVKDSPVLRELEERLQSWIDLEGAWQISRDSSKKAADQALAAYLSSLTRVAENAMMSNLLADYHAIFWLVHSLQLSRHFSRLKRSILSVDTHTGRSKVDQVRYRVFARWSLEVREQMTQLASRIGGVLEGEEERGLQFFRLLQENVLILTEEFISPDLRELRSYVTGHLNQNYFAFREHFERMRAITTSLLATDRVFRSSAELYHGRVPTEITTGLLIDQRFQNFIFAHPEIDRALGPEERELIRTISGRVARFAVLHTLRRGIQWMTVEENGEVISTDRRSDIRFARTTRPIDYGHSGVVDPMVYRFGLIYDITAFSETLGNIARGGAKEELGSYRQMLLFQRRLDAIATRHRLTLEKFLGDGAFYTTRRVIPLLRAAVEIQGCYEDARSRGFAFDKGIRIALNFGYYRLLPMRFNTASNERIMEFYGPGLVELSRLTTGKAMKEIDEIETFLISHGYDLHKVQQFFAPLRSRPVPLDSSRSRSYQAYIDGNGHLVNEGIVASLPLVEELSDELLAEAHQLFRLLTPWGNYIAFKPDPGGVEYIGLSIIGSVSLKGLEKIEVAEVVPFRQGQVEIMPFEEGGVLLKLLRHEYHNRRVPEISGASTARPAAASRDSEPQSTPKAVAPAQQESLIDLVLYPKAAGAVEREGIIVCQWNPWSDELTGGVRIGPDDLRELLGGAPLSRETMERNGALLQRAYQRLRRSGTATTSLQRLRSHKDHLAFLLGDRVRSEVLES
jgi:hypothetical protein